MRQLILRFFTILLVATPFAAVAQTSAYLGMPHDVNGALPRLLSQTGAFKDMRKLEPAVGLIPYDLVVPFWSDGAAKSRLVAIPQGGKIVFSPDAEWTFPAGTVFVKTFELATDATHPDVKRRLETRLLVRDDNGGVYGVVYRWRPDNSDADLVDGSGLTEPVSIHDADGSNHVQTWYYPSRKDCMTCHNSLAGGVLGPKTRQLNRDLVYAAGVSDNQLHRFNELGLFTSKLTAAQLATLPKLAAADDASRSLEDKARSYLDANCSHCHRPGGTVANFDARYQTPLAQQQLIDGEILIDQGIDRPHVITPHDVWRSIAFMRISTNGDIRMPPIARQTIDRRGVALLQQWILSMPGKEVLAPPQLTPEGGNFTKAVAVVLRSDEAGAEIRYTLDGSTPGPKDPLYTAPLTISDATVVRARAYKDGFTRSIVAEAVFTFDK
ncbi:MAG TPA: chitobiase/beta-hexosaminidase C-terminal domain-containing protein [Candidatus Acidoferrum sp.]|nr:chitobiase/beta-hexosaminidase C-terminal domain-containing protein [Candidatus Acidoferrum sp.]